MKKLLMKILGIKCQCEFVPNPPFVFPEVDAPEVNREQYYAYNHMGGLWYGRKFYTNPEVTYLRLNEAPTLGAWINEYPLLQDIDYVNEFENKKKK